MRVAGLTRESLQGDVAFCECLAQMGCDVEYDAEGITVQGKPLHGIDVDMNAISDTVQDPGRRGAVRRQARRRSAVSATFATRKPIASPRWPPNCAKLGADVDELPDGLRIRPRPLHGATIDTYDDHRMAMSLALVGLVTSRRGDQRPGLHGQDLSSLLRGSGMRLRR